MSKASLILLVVLACCAPPAAVAPTPAPPPAPTPAPAPVLAIHHASEIHIDRRIELMSIVMRLAGAEEFHQAPASAYLADVDRTFGPFANHPAVVATRQLREAHGIGFDAPVELAIRLDDQLDLRAPDELVAIDGRWRGVDLAAYTAELRDFARDTGLDAFMASHAAYYRAVEAVVRDRVDAEHPVDWFDARFGARAHARYLVVPSLLDGGSNYGPHTTLPDGTLEMVQVLGLYRLDAHGLPMIDDDTVDVLIHEMAHSYINPVFERHRAELARAGGALFPQVASIMQRQAYGDWETMFDESGVRAATVLYVRERRGDRAASQAIREEISLGFLWTRELEAVLRHHHGDVEAVMPAVVGLFDQLASHGVPAMRFEGPVNTVFQHRPVLVAPVTSDRALTAYVGEIHREFFANAPIVEASAHVLGDHPDRGVVAYGSPQSNPVVAAVLARAGISIDHDRIAIGATEFTGPGLVLIACWVRGDDPMNGVAIYTATDDHDVVGINAVVHGPHDWVVARHTATGLAIVRTGDFSHGDDGSWRL